VILYPSVDKLLEHVNSRYSLVMLAAKRAHELDMQKDPMLTEYTSVKNVGRALEEVEAGKLKIQED
jgi:DNA-directed RNA polymerase subunit omega